MEVGKEGERVNSDPPSDPEGEGSAEDLGGEDAEDGREEAEEDGGAGLEEDGIWEAESQGQGVGRHVERDRPHPQPLRQIPERLECRVAVPHVPPVRPH